MKSQKKEKNRQISFLPVSLWKAGKEAFNANLQSAVRDLKFSKDVVFRRKTTALIHAPPKTIIVAPPPVSPPSALGLSHLQQQQHGLPHASLPNATSKPKNAADQTVPAKQPKQAQPLNIGPAERHQKTKAQTVSLVRLARKFLLSLFKSHFTDNVHSTPNNNFTTESVLDSRVASPKNNNEFSSVNSVSTNHVDPLVDSSIVPTLIAPTKNNNQIRRVNSDVSHTSIPRKNIMTDFSADLINGRQLNSLIPALSNASVYRENNASVSTLDFSKRSNQIRRVNSDLTNAKKFPKDPTKGSDISKDISTFTTASTKGLHRRNSLIPTLSIAIPHRGENAAVAQFASLPR
ncbi:hypothetical protein HK096_003460, partial [Nowakowskiella sp. JEL0078]